MKIFKNIFFILCTIIDIKTVYKTNVFHLAKHVYSDNAPKTSKCSKNVICALSEYTCMAKWNMFVN